MINNEYKAKRVPTHKPFRETMVGENRQGFIPAFWQRVMPFGLIR